MNALIRHVPRLAEQGCCSALALVSVAFLGTSLNEQEFALYVLLYAAISLPYLVSTTFWAYPTLIFLPKRFSKSAWSYARTVTLLNAVTAALLAALMIAITHMYFRPIPPGVGASALVAAVAWAGYDCLRRLAYASHAGERLVVPSCLLVPVYALAVAAFWSRGRLDAASAFLSLAFAYASAGLGAAALLGRPAERTRTRMAPLLPIALRHWRYARWLLASTMAYFVTSHGFFLLGARLLKDVELGGMRAAHNLMGTMTVVLLVFENQHVPKASAVFHHDGLGALLRYVGQMYSRSVLAFVAAAVGFAVAAYIVFGVLYGVKFSESRWLVFVFAAYQLVLLLSVPAQAAWNAQEKSYVCLLGAASAAVVACIVGVPLVFWGRALGAALGMLISVSTLTSVLILALVAVNGREKSLRRDPAAVGT